MRQLLSKHFFSMLLVCFSCTDYFNKEVKLRWMLMSPRWLTLGPATATNLLYKKEGGWINEGDCKKKRNFINGLCKLYTSCILGVNIFHPCEKMLQNWRMSWPAKRISLNNNQHNLNAFITLSINRESFFSGNRIFSLLRERIINNTLLIYSIICFIIFSSPFLLVQI